MMLPVTITSSSTGGTAWASGTAARSSFDPVIQLDFTKTGGTIVETVVTTSGAGLVYNVEFSADAPIAAASSQMTWFSSGSSALSSNAYVGWSFPVRAVRLNVTTGTSLMSVQATVLQSQV